MSDVEIVQIKPVQICEVLFNLPRPFNVICTCEVVCYGFPTTIGNILYMRQ